MPRVPEHSHAPPDKWSEKIRGGPDGLLPPVVWRTTGDQHRVLHALRGGHTLCGIPVLDGQCSSPLGGAVLCLPCARVPDGHCTHHDLMVLGATYRQVDYWCRQGLLYPDNPAPGSGRRRTFPPEEARVAAVMAVLTQAGIAPAAACRAARGDGWLSPMIRITWEHVRPGIYDVSVGERR